MEKAKPDVKVTLTNGKEVFVKDLTLELASLIPLDGKKENDKFTSITLKKGLVKEEASSWTERRIFQRTDMDKPCLYDLTLPKTLDKAKETFGEATCLDYIIESARVDMDSSNASGSQVIPLDKKAIAIMKKMAKGEAPTKEEAEVMLQWHIAKFGVPQAQVDAMKKDMKAHGFGK